MNPYGIGYREPVPGVIKAAAVLLFISGGFAVLGGLVAFLGSPVTLFFGAVTLIVGGFQIRAGVALLSLRDGARNVAISVAIIGAILCAVPLFYGAYATIVGVMCNFVILFLLFQREAVETF